MLTDALCFRKHRGTRVYGRLSTLTENPPTRA